MEKGQEEMKHGEDDMKNEIEEKKQGQDKMKNRIEETKTEIKEEMQKGQ